MKKKAVFLSGEDTAKIMRVYDPETQNRLHEYVDLFPELIKRGNAEQYADVLRETEIVFSTWGMPAFSDEELEHYFPSLKIVFYGAGSVQGFARPFLARNIKVVSSWAANAVPVAEYTAAQIVLAHKGFFQAAWQYKQNYKEARRTASNHPGNYGAKVGIIGAGMIGKKVISLLGNYNLAVDVFDPFLGDDAAKELGVRKTDLNGLFSSCDTISNHLANRPETVGMLHYELFSRMLPHATFINTGRGAQVVEADLIRSLREVPTRTALLDVTNPEPVQEDSEFLALPNVFLSPHLAGSKGREVARMGAFMAEECERYLNGEPLRYEVTIEMLATMA